MCAGSPQPVKPKKVRQGPGNKQIKQQKREIKDLRQDQRQVAGQFRQQLQSQIDDTLAQTEEYRQQIAEVLAPPVYQVVANNYGVSTSQQAPPAGALTTERITPMRQQPTGLRIMPGATASNPGAGLSIGA